ncbi:36746_t:CDS:2, partial [Gigaspora margarita]
KERYEFSITVSEESSEERLEKSSEEDDDESSISISEKPRFNASVQKLALIKQKAAEKKLKELNNLHCIAQDPQLRCDFLVQISETKKILMKKKKKKIKEDDKAKVPLGITAIGWTFKTIQSDNESVAISDHDFPKIDSGPDENPRYLKNIKEYCKLFKKLNFDYFTIQTHAPEQSAYNPVERSMSTLSEKLARIVLPVNHFGSHLDAVGNVTDSKLEIRNFCYAGEKLCDI